MSKCKGCGITIQNIDKNKLGYSPKIDGKLCKRCFEITNYNFHEKESKIIDNNQIINGINNKKCATMFLCDVLNLNSQMMEIYNVINNPKILVITKADIIPKNLNLNLLAENIKRIYHIKDLIFMSSLSGYGKSKVLKYLTDHQKVVFAGPTSSGKSSLINYLFNLKLTVSNHKNTTQEFINLSVDGNEIIDAPGFNEDFLLDNVKQNGFIKPRTISISKEFCLCVGDLEFYADRDINVTLFFPKNILINTKKAKKEFANAIKIPKQSDLVVNNLGFIYFKEEANIKINDNNYLEVRESIIGGK